MESNKNQIEEFFFFVSFREHFSGCPKMSVLSLTQSSFSERRSVRLSCCSLAGRGLG